MRTLCKLALCLVVSGASAQTVTNVSPGYGALGANNPVTITGHGFTGATGVMFGKKPAGSFTVKSDTTIEATSPKVFSPRTVTVTVQ